jgi:DNA end-binding protein Ku
MAKRPSWEGFLKMSLVVCAVKLYRAAGEARAVSFHLLNPKTNNRIQMKPHDPETGEVDRQDLVHGYEIEKDRYVVIEDEELRAIRLPSTKTMAIDEFVDESEIDALYYDTPYFLVPDGAAANEAYSVIREAMRAEHKVGIARLVIAHRERTVAIAPRGKGFLVRMLRQKAQIEDEHALLASIDAAKPEPDMVEIATKIIGQKSAKFDGGAFPDHYETALRELIEERGRGATPVTSAEPEGPKVVDLMAALKASLKDSGTKGRQRATSDEGDNVVPLRRSATEKEKRKSTGTAKGQRGRRRHV